MPTKKQTKKENVYLKTLAGLLGTGIREVHGEHAMQASIISATNTLLVKKGIVTVDELRQSFVDWAIQQDPKLVAHAIKFMKEEGMSKQSAARKARK